MSTRPPTTRINRLAASTGLTVTARVAVVIGTPCMLAIGGWVALTTAQNNAALSGLQATVSGNIQSETSAHWFLQRQIDGFKEASDRLFGDHETRIRNLESGKKK